MLGIIFATAAAVLTIVLAVYAYLYRKRHAKNALNAGYEDGSEGLFSGWDASLYTLFAKAIRNARCGSWASIPSG